MYKIEILTQQSSLVFDDRLREAQASVLSFPYCELAFQYIFPSIQNQVPHPISSYTIQSKNRLAELKSSDFEIKEAKRTASMPPPQTPSSCARIQCRLSCWNGNNVALKSAGCFALTRSGIAILASRSPHTFLSSG